MSKIKKMFSLICFFPLFDIKLGVLMGHSEQVRVMSTPSARLEVGKISLNK
jgi:hypothetical protein